MKLTSIAKGKIVKEEEREFSFSHHTLNQIEEHICNSEDSSYSTAQLIHDVVSYDPSTANNAQLADDMRICFAWYSTIKEGFSDVKERVKKSKFSEKDVVHLSKVIYSEIEKRKREGKMKHEWNVENMKKHSKDLFDIISKGQSLQTSLVTKEKEEANSNVPMRIEKLAELEHKQWSHWTKYMLNNLTEENIKRWKGQIKMPYSKLSEKEKESDREWARRALLIFEESKELELDPEIKNWFRNNLPIHPGGTSDKYDSIELNEFLDKWNSFVVKKPFIALVGSLANQERTEGDIDILVKARDPTPLREALDHAISKLYELKEDALADLLIQVNEFLHSDSTFLNAKWRIERAFPEWSGRLHILDDSFSGPFTNFVELADLVAVSREEKERKEMAQMKKLKLFEWFPMLKPIHGRKKEEIYSIDSVIETIKSRKEDWFEIGVYVEKKFDGVHSQAHVAKDYESGKIARIFTEEGTMITKNCPTLRDELRKISGEFILCGELELWKDGKHQPRADCAGVLNSKEVHPDEKYLRFNIFDKLWHKGKDIHDLPFSERIIRLDSIVDTDHVKKTKRILCHSEAEVRKAIENVSKEVGSEGAYLKKADFIYELDGKTLNNIKFKNELSVEVQIVKVNIVKERK